MKCEKCNNPMREIELFSSVSWHCDSCEVRGACDEVVAEAAADISKEYPDGAIIYYRTPQNKAAAQARIDALNKRIDDAQVKMAVPKKRKLHKLREVLLTDEHPHYWDIPDVTWGPINVNCDHVITTRIVDTGNEHTATQVELVGMRYWFAGTPEEFLAHWEEDRDE